MKIVVISPNFRHHKFWRRWELLAQRHKDLEVVLLAPYNWTEGSFKNYTMGSVKQLTGESFEFENFKVRLIHTKQNLFFDWTSTDMGGVIKEESPDFLYVIGTHTQMSMMQALYACKKYCSKTKRLTFTMRSDSSLEKAVRGNWKSRVVKLGQGLINKYNTRNSNAIFCHYPEARDAVIREGFKGPVFLNTQIGVDRGMFSFSAEGRERVRRELNIGKSFLFGSATRFNPEKGIFDILDALPREGDWKYMILGSGREDEIAAIRRKISILGFDEKVIMPGVIGWDKLADYLSAFDCALHVPRTTNNWKETFSLALVQAMAVGRPVIGNTSGSVPYQCGPDGTIVKEGDLDALRNAMRRMMDNPEEAVLIGEKQQRYVLDSFETERINECFYKVLVDLSKNVYDPRKIDTVPDKYKDSIA